jgi:hypothetical protein
MMNDKRKCVDMKNSSGSIQTEGCVRYRKVYAPEPLINEAQKLMQQLKAQQSGQDVPSKTL